MTTGRINQVANLSSARGWVPPPNPWLPGRPEATRGLGAGLGVPAELQRSAVGSGTGLGRPTLAGSGLPPRRERPEDCVGASARPLPDGCEPSGGAGGPGSPSHTPLEHVGAGRYSAASDLSRPGLDSAAPPVAWGAGRSTHWASSSLLIGVRSVDNYAGPAQ